MISDPPLRALMTRLFLRSGLAVGLAATGLLTGCTDDACIFVGEGATTCPSTGEALAIMNPPCGGRPVTSVATQGELKGDLCCYQVHFDDDVPTPRDRDPVCPGTTSSTTSGSSSSSTGVGGASGGGGFGGAGPGGAGGGGGGGSGMGGGFGGGLGGGQ